MFDLVEVGGNKVIHVMFSNGGWRRWDGSVVVCK